MKQHELGYYLRKMLSIERKVKNKKKLLWNIEWTRYQRKAAKLYSEVPANEKQRELIFRLV
jgi:hypothetical protein